MEKMSEASEALIRARWGYPKRVARSAFDELFNHHDLCLDHDDQISHMLNLAVLACVADGPDDFIRRFETEILNP
jgi:hypothetical protein